MPAGGFWELCCCYLSLDTGWKKAVAGWAVAWAAPRLAACALPSSCLPFPGEVVLLVPMAADGPAGSWQLLPDGRAASPTTSFTQQDISDGIVWYRHSGAEVESDSFQFQVFLVVPRPLPGNAARWQLSEGTLTQTRV